MEISYVRFTPECGPLTGARNALNSAQPNGDWPGNFPGRGRAFSHGKRKEDQGRDLSSAKKGNALYGRGRFVRGCYGDCGRVKEKPESPLPTASGYRWRIDADIPHCGAS